MAKTTTKTEEEQQSEFVDEIIAATGGVQSISTSYDDKKSCYVTTVTLQGDKPKKCQATGTTATEAMGNAVLAVKTLLKSL